MARLQPKGFRAQAAGAIRSDMISAMIQSRLTGQAIPLARIFGRNFMAILPIAARVMIASCASSIAVRIEMYEVAQFGIGLAINLLYRSLPRSFLTVSSIILARGISFFRPEYQRLFSSGVMGFDTPR
ncbi:hypothetical protein ES707_09542 [subsurface metagenome]